MYRHPDEMSTLIEPSHLHHDSYYGSAKASAVAAPEVGRQGEADPVGMSLAQ
jgi:hypothetical protein